MGHFQKSCCLAERAPDPWVRVLWWIPLSSRPLEALQGAVAMCRQLRARLAKDARWLLQHFVKTQGVHENQKGASGSFRFSVYSL